MVSTWNDDQGVVWGLASEIIEYVTMVAIIGGTSGCCINGWDGKGGGFGWR